MATPVTTIAADGSRWRVDDEPFDAVVVATPAAPTAPLLATAAPEVARLQALMDHVGVVMVTLAVDDWPERLIGRSGYLVPKPVQRTVTAVSFGSQKWAHWRRAGQEVLRVSLGRDGLPVEHLDDAAVLDRVVTEVGGHLSHRRPALGRSDLPLAGGVPAVPPAAPPMVGEVDAALPAGLYVAGASYGGIGVPACIAQAEATAAPSPPASRVCAPEVCAPAGPTRRPERLGGWGWQTWWMGRIGRVLATAVVVAGAPATTDATLDVRPSSHPWPRRRRGRPRTTTTSPTTSTTTSTATSTAARPRRCADHDAPAAPGATARRPEDGSSEPAHRDRIDRDPAPRAGPHDVRGHPPDDARQRPGPLAGHGACPASSATSSSPVTVSATTATSATSTSWCPATR